MGPDAADNSGLDFSESGISMSPRMGVLGPNLKDLPQYVPHALDTMEKKWTQDPLCFSLPEDDRLSQNSRIWITSDV